MIHSIDFGSHFPPVVAFYGVPNVSEPAYMHLDETKQAVTTLTMEFKNYGIKTQIKAPSPNIKKGG